MSNNKKVNVLKVAFLLVLPFLWSCGQRETADHLKIGFGKADLVQAGIFEDPLRESSVSEDLYAKEEKFGIVDRIEGRWRPGSGGVRKLVDSLFVTAMYGEDQNGPWAIVAMDFGSFRYTTLDDLQTPLINELGIPKERLVFLPSHGHANPRMDQYRLRAAVFDAVDLAKNSRTGVDVAAVNLQIDGKRYAINRRVHVDGIGTQTVMFNDYCVVHEDHVDVTGQIWNWVENLGVNPDEYLDKGTAFITNKEVDNDLQALFFRDRQTGELVGSFTKWTAHPVIVSAKVVDGDVSADFPGYLKRAIEDELGGISMFGQGTSGDIRPLNREYSHTEAEAYGKALAGKIIQGYYDTIWQPVTKLEYHTEPVHIPLRDNLFLNDEEIQAVLEEVERQYDNTFDPQQRRILQNEYWRYYRAAGSRSMVRPEWAVNNQLEISLYALNINDHVILATHGEIFYDIGKKMVMSYKKLNPVLVSIANDYISYIPTDEAILHGGYEPSVSIIAPGTSELFIQSSERLLGRIYDN